MQEGHFDWCLRIQHVTVVEIMYIVIKPWRQLEDGVARIVLPAINEHSCYWPKQGVLSKHMFLLQNGHAWHQSDNWLHNSSFNHYPFLLFLNLHQHHLQHINVEWDNIQCKKSRIDAKGGKEIIYSSPAMFWRISKTQRIASSSSSLTIDQLYWKALTSYETK